MKERLLQEFEAIYGDSKRCHVYFAPGRVNLIGEHIDYSGGYVMPCALTMGTYGVARKREDRKLCFSSLNMDKVIVEKSLDEIKPDPDNDWTNYLLGVIAAFAKEGYEIGQGLDLMLYGTIPSGAGLSSSASVEVLMDLS